MPIAAFFVVFTGAFTVAVLYPHLRAIAIMVSLICGGILGFLWIDQAGRERGHQTDIGPDEVTLSSIELEDGARFTRIAGRVRNDSTSHHLREFTLTATLYDCPDEGATRSDCAVIAQQDAIARVDVPPNQTRGFEAIVGLADHLTAQGVAVWDYDITGTRASAPRP